MRRLQLLVFVAPLLALFACHEVTAPIRAGSPALVSHHPSPALVTPSTTVQISAGHNHVCGLKADGTVVCWGENGYGQATVPDGLVSVAQVSAGIWHTCALKTDGTVVCWGFNEMGQATVPEGLSSVAQVSAGHGTTCVLKTNGMVFCWGLNNHGQVSVPEGLASVAQVSAGLSTCALKVNATVTCWGYASYNPPSGLAQVAQLSSSYIHICALKADGTVVCWNDSYFGEAMVPDGLASVAQVSAGYFHTCALKNDGTVVCWGYNDQGQATVPEGLSSVAQVSTGMRYSCALKTDGTVVCWGPMSVPVDLNLGVRDSTPPTVTHAISGTPNTSGWYASDVTVTFSVTDPESAVRSSGCGTHTVSASTPIDGITVTCVATSSGGTTSDAVTIKLDKVSPLVTFTGNAGSYTVDQSVTISCTTSDNLSGVASSTCAAISGGADSFVAGTNTYSATATDHAGNIGTATTAFTVTVTSHGLCRLVQRWVSNPGVATSLCVKLDHVSYVAFRNELKAQTGKHISDANASVLQRLVNELDP